MALLPYRPRLAKDESISSFLHRLSNAYVLSIPDLLQSASVLNARETWHSGDTDLLKKENTLLRLSHLTGHSFQELRRASLASYEGLLSQKKLKEKQGPAWVLGTPQQRKVRGITITRGGTQFCPLCVAGENPYFRITWRFSFVAACPEHRIFLLDCCPNCAVRIYPCSTAAATKAEDLFHCRECKQDFRSLDAGLAVKHLPEAFADRLLRLQDLHLTILRLSQNVEIQNLPGYFRFFSSMLSLVIGDGYPNTQIMRLRRFLAARVQLEAPKSWRLDEPHESQFDFLTLDERVRYLLMVSVLVDPWPEHLASLHEDFNQIASRVSSNVLGSRFWLFHPKNDQFEIDEKYLLGSSLAHRFLQQLLSASPDEDLLNYEHLRWSHRVTNLSLDEYEFRHKEFRDALLPNEDPYLLPTFEFEMEKWNKSLRTLARNKEFSVRI